MAYVPLWCKSNYSFLEGASHPEELIEQAHAFGLSAIAMTDRDGVHGVVRAHMKAQELGVHLLIGAELTVAGDAPTGAPASTRPPRDMPAPRSAVLVRRPPGRHRPPRDMPAPRSAVLVRRPPGRHLPPAFFSQPTAPATPTSAA